MSHTDLRDKIIEVLQGKYPNGRFFARQVLFTRINGRPISVGKAGQADIYGFISCADKTAIHVEIEVKTEKDTLKEEQKCWMNVCKKLNVCYVLARSVKQTLDEVYGYLKERNKTAI